MIKAKTEKKEYLINMKQELMQYMISDYVEQPDFLSNCPYNPILTYRSDKKFYSQILFVYGLNDEKFYTSYVFSFTNLVSTKGFFEGILPSMKEVDKNVKTNTELLYMGSVEKGIKMDFVKFLYPCGNDIGLEEIKYLCKNTKSDAIYLTEIIKDDEDMELDIQDIAAFYLLAGTNQRRKLDMEVPELLYDNTNEETEDNTDEEDDEPKIDGSENIQ